MSRAIKFRAWDKEMTWMRKVASISFSRAGIPDGVICFGPNENSGTTWLKDAEISLMQFTGLTDKNGREIYEGDILIQNYHGAPIGVVEFRGGEFRVRYQSRDGDTRDSSIVGFGGLGNEVIGNIYETPQLLTV
jgi:uncharacterized phage protein (TIGR01671 family)